MTRICYLLDTLQQRNLHAVYGSNLDSQLELVCPRGAGTPWE